MEKEEKIKTVRIIIAALLLVCAMIAEKKTSLNTCSLLILYLVPYLVAGYDVLIEAASNIIRGKGLNEDFLMSAATIGAISIGFLPNAEGQYPEAVFVMLFYQVGEVFQGTAEGRSRRSIASLMNIRPDTAHVEREGIIIAVKPETLAIGDIIVIKPGEKVPVDGVITQGVSSLDTMALTGESVPHAINIGDDILSGCVNISGVVKARVTKAFGESTATKVLNLVEKASENKSKSERFITRFARVYTPIVVSLAVFVAIIPPLFIGSEGFATWIYRALLFLIVSCPCALVISVPLSFFGGIGGASRRGILVKGSNYLETLARTGIVCFDKTGTITKGVFEVTAVHPDKIDKKELLHLAAHVERFSTHPIAFSLRAAYPRENDGCKVENVREIAGEGVTAVVNGQTVSVGNDKLMDSVGANWHPCHKVGTIIHVAVGATYVGHIVVTDKIKDDAALAVSMLKDKGVRRSVLLTGDRDDIARDVAAKVGINEYHAQMLPADKVRMVETLIKEKKKGESLAFVGDGINDAPVLARADVGIAMGALGSDAAIEAADVVIMDDKPQKIATAMVIARRTLRIARENTLFAIIVKVAILILAVFGIATMWMAVMADVGVMVLSVLNATRTLSTSQT